jgi:hypothetical protein
MLCDIGIYVKKPPIGNAPKIILYKNVLENNIGKNRNLMNSYVLVMYE